MEEKRTDKNGSITAPTAKTAHQAVSERGTVPSDGRARSEAEGEGTVGTLSVALNTPRPSDGTTVASGIACVSVIGQIEGHYVLDSTQKTTRYEQLLPELVRLEQDEGVSGILLLINTMGGDVEAGLALAEMIASMTKPTASIVLGGGHSIGVPLAVCSRHSFIVPSATMTIHPVRSSGTVIGVPQSFYYFERMQDRILDFIVAHSHARRETLRALMMNTDEIANDVGSIIDGKQAVEIGLIDAVGGIGEALSILKRGLQTPAKNVRRKSKDDKNEAKT